MDSNAVSYSEVSVDILELTYGICSLVDYENCKVLMRCQ